MWPCICPSFFLMGIFPLWTISLNTIMWKNGEAHRSSWGSASWTRHTFPWLRGVLSYCREPELQHLPFLILEQVLLTTTQGPPCHIPGQSTRLQFAILGQVSCNPMQFSAGEAQSAENSHIIHVCSGTLHTFSDITLAESYEFPPICQTRYAVCSELGRTVL